MKSRLPPNVRELDDRFSKQGFPERVNSHDAVNSILISASGGERQRALDGGDPKKLKHAKIPRARLPGYSTIGWQT